MTEPADFSLALGGPLYQLWRRTRLSGDGFKTADNIIDLRLKRVF